jgi:AcrR family transcriptional regulator
LKTTKQRQKAETRKPDIVWNFYQMILEEGLEGASIGKVAKRMTIHPSLIIHYFQNKDNLIQALVDHLIQGAGKLYRTLNGQTNAPGKRLRNLVEIFFSDAWYSMSDIGVDFAVLSLSRRSPQTDASIRELYAQVKKHIVNEIGKRIDRKNMTIKDPERAAEIIITIYEGYRHFKHFYVNKKNAESFRRDMVDAVVSMIIKN